MEDIILNNSTSSTLAHMVDVEAMESDDSEESNEGSDEKVKNFFFFWNVAFSFI